MRTPCLEACASQVVIGGTVFGSEKFGWIAGPCAIESSAQLSSCVVELRKAGIEVIRGGLFKPRTSTYSFQGIGKAGVDLVRRLKEKFIFPFVSEVIDAESLEVLQPIVDAVQIGSRNCLNYALLKRVGRAGKPVILKRGFAVTVEEYLNAAEYLAVNGASEIILCERGIRTITEVTRFTLDVGVIAWLKNRFPMPVIADPSHAAGNAELVAPLTLAAVAAGADGIMVECTPEPENARCDSRQQLAPERLSELKKQVENIRPGGTELC